MRSPQPAARSPQRLCVVDEYDRVLVTFHANGSIHCNTHGVNDATTLKRINFFLPRGYALRRRESWDQIENRLSFDGSAVYLLGPGRDFKNPIAVFLVSTTFTPIVPEPLPPSGKSTAAPTPIGGAA